MSKEKTKYEGKCPDSGDWYDLYDVDLKKSTGLCEVEGWRGLYWCTFSEIREK